MTFIGYKVMQISLVTVFIWCDDVWMYFISKEMLWEIQIISMENSLHLVVLFLNTPTQIVLYFSQYAYKQYSCLGAFNEYFNQCNENNVFY